MYHFKPEFGTAFYHLNQSHIPDEIWNLLAQPEDAQQLRFDEYGFIIDRPSAVTDVTPTAEADTESTVDDVATIRQSRERTYQQIKEKWIKYLESEYQKLAPSSNFDLSKFDADINRAVPLLDQLIASSPITNELRPFFWMRFSGALALKLNSKWTYTELSDQSTSIATLSDAQVTQVLPSNVCFQSASSVCSRRLRHVLQITKWYQKTTLKSASSELAASGTTTPVNLSLIAAHLLLVCNEEDAFWLLLKITNDLQMADCIDIILQLLDKCCPMVGALLAKHDIEFSLIASNWFASLFAGLLKSAHLLYTMWDLLFYEGPIFLVQFTLGMLIIECRRLEACTDSAKLFNELSDLPTVAFDCDPNQWWTQSEKLTGKVLQAWKTGKNVVNHFQAIPRSLFYYERNCDSPNGPANCGPVNGLLTTECSAEYLRLKNVKQTQLMVNLHEAIVSIAHHFQAYDLEAKYKLEPEFELTLVRPTTLNLPRKHSSRRLSTGSAGSSASDQDDGLQNRLRPYRRAKALIDFEANDQDELGFTKNDIITIVNEKDEHCWVGELNGEVGWFPAKFVEMLDERSVDYSIAGDDSVVPFINTLVRGKLCSALKAIFAYDLKRRSYFLPVHPWMVLEEITEQLGSGGEFKQIYSRLVLTKTFRLDEFAHVLSPSELLYRSMAAVNHSHGPNAPLDVKFRSLICMGLNQYVLHDWIQLICISQAAIVAKHYGPNSFLTAPVWKMIKAELKLLVQFSFHLNPNAEIECLSSEASTAASSAGQPAATKSPVTKEGVWDMLVKYHLFSWDI